MTTWIALITSLPTENATARMRAWRNLKSSGAAVLRDGVYLMPERDECLQRLQTVATDIQTADGTAIVVKLEELADATFASLFDRSADFANLLSDIAVAREKLTPETAHETLKQVRKLRKSLTSIVAIDYFPGEAQKQADEALRDLEQRTIFTLSPDEPIPAHVSIEKLNIQDFQGRVWATRRRPWVDRMSCGWLIRRFIDPNAQILWLGAANECPNDALGFDFDGATFTHVGARVSFEVLLASFSLETPALQRIGTLVHFLDVGGAQPPEATGIESALAGLRETITDDNQLLELASHIFDGLLANFEKGQKS